MELVFDASAALAWIVPGQETGASRTFRDSLPASLIAPYIFRLEVRQAIVRLERRRLVPSASLDVALSELESEIEFVSDETYFPTAQVWAFARHFELSLYDTVYVALALATGAGLVSRDGSMIAAARRAGVEVYDLR